MWRIKLQKLFAKNKELRSFLENMATSVGSPIQIQDLSHTIVLGDSDRDLTHRFPLELNGEPLGWLIGNKHIESIVPFLNFILAGEARKKTMADEVLDAYREITLLYNVSEKLTTSLKIQHVIDVALTEATRINKGEPAGSSCSPIMIERKTRHFPILGRRKPSTAVAR